MTSLIIQPVRLCESDYTRTMCTGIWKEVGLLGKLLKRGKICQKEDSERLESHLVRKNQNVNQHHGGGEMRMFVYLTCSAWVSIRDVNGQNTRTHFKNWSTERFSCRLRLIATTIGPVQEKAIGTMYVSLCFYMLFFSKRKKRQFKLETNNRIWQPNPTRSTLNDNIHLKIKLLSKI